MARLNKGFAEGGYTNPLLRSIDLAHPPVEKTVNGKKVTETWSQNVLHSPWETLDARLVGKIHASGESGAEPIHGGHPAVASAMEEKGTPKSFASRAGFMPGDEFVAPNLKNDTKYKDAKAGFFSSAHQDSKDFHNRVEDAVKKLGYKRGDIRDVIGDWVDGAENSIRTHSEDQPFDLMQYKGALKGLYDAQKQVLVWNEHPAGDDSLYTLKFKETDPEKVRQTLTDHGLRNRTLEAETPAGQGVEARIFDDNGGARDGIEKLRKAGALESFTQRNGQGKWLGDPAGKSRDVAAHEYRRTLGLLETGERGVADAIHQRYQGRPGYGDLRDLAPEADAHYRGLKAESGQSHWMPGASDEGIDSEPEASQSKVAWMPAQSAGADSDETDKARTAWRIQGNRR
jgi:hypothetical protein